MELVEELHLSIGAHFTGGGTGLRSGMSWLGHADADHTENDHGDGTDGPLLPVGSAAIGFCWNRNKIESLMSVDNCDPSIIQIVIGESRIIRKIQSTWCADV